MTSVLVIDDEAAIRLLCRVNLEAEKMEVVEAADGQTGLELARAEKPDAILLDVMMPGVDGWRVAEELLGDGDTSDIPIIFLTARARSSATARAASTSAASTTSRSRSTRSSSPRSSRASSTGSTAASATPSAARSSPSSARSPKTEFSGSKMWSAPWRVLRPAGSDQDELAAAHECMGRRRGAQLINPRRATPTRR